MTPASDDRLKSGDGLCRSLTLRSRTVCAALMFLLTICVVSLTIANPSGRTASAQKWVATWSTAPQLVETGNNPPSPGLSNNTLRQIVHISIGGDSLRLRLTNEFSKSPVKVNAVHIALSTGNGTIDTTTDEAVFFNGMPDVTMQPGTAITSDPFQLTVQPLTDVAITIYFGATSPDVTGHPGSRTTSYLLTGNKISGADFTAAVKTDHWYVINTLDVLAPVSASAVAILGNSITDGRGSGTNKQNRWPDELSRRFQATVATKQVAVLNEGIGGNCVLGTCLGPSAVSRFTRDVLNQNGITWCVIFEGINDIGGASGAQGSTKVAQDLITAFGKLIDSAHTRNILVYGATLLPFGGSSYDTPDHQRAWQTLNDWIRHSGRFDAVIDLDSAMHDPAKPATLLPTYDSGDHLHPSETGHHMIAEAVDLTLFGASGSTGINQTTRQHSNDFSLLQNYPNPFNPSTKFSYRLPKESFVTLTVYDVLGNEITTLVNEKKAAGNYEVNFNAANLASGTYYYKLSAGTSFEVKQMTLIR